MIFANWKRELKPVRFGKKRKLTCGQCNQEAQFRECTVNEGIKVYALIDLWKKTSRVM